MTRIEHEDAILAALKAALPAGVAVGSLPLGMNDRKALDVRDCAVWVVYVGGQRRGDNNANSKMQVEDWTWSVLILAKNYRSSGAASVTGLGLLETVNAALSGLPIAGRTLTRLRDQLADLPDGCGLLGYEARFSINIFAPRGA